MSIIDQFVHKVNQDENEVYKYLKSLADDIYDKFQHEIAALVVKERKEKQKITIYRFSLIAPYRSNNEYTLFEVFIPDTHPLFYSLYVKLPIGTKPQHFKDINEDNLVPLKTEIESQFSKNQAWVALVQSLLPSKYEPA